MTINPERVRCLFGTDGVRDVANRGDMTPEMALRLGRSYVLFLAERGVPRPRIAVGRDTRRSGLMLEAALAAGMTSAGADVFSLGVIPTPGVSFAAKKAGMQGGAVISASHNPAEYNGIKFMDSSGCKLSDDMEAAIEEYMGDNLTDDWRPTGASIGVLRQAPEMTGQYVDWLATLWKENLPFPAEGVMDCAHGAAYSVAPDLFSRLGGRWTVVGNTPDGLNINEGVGVMKMPHLCGIVKEKGLSIGIAYDGDADRVLLCDGRGRTLNGDIMLWVLARWLNSEGRLGSGAVATVMSNMALEEHLGKENISVFRCQVGDRYVLETMNEKGALLGGEQSGHVIMSPVVNTGDGICTGLCFIEACQALGEDIDTLADRFSPYPQVLKNVSIPRDVKPDADFLRELTEETEPMLDGSGRVFIRPSGTEPLMRILVEARDRKLMEEVSSFLENTIREKFS
ncbi:MAG: phosphoglucosamine mutase [Synergistaceae bacterium]|nr:phosphoglucosamine mutase [Synergistaceae bacterium]